MFSSRQYLQKKTGPFGIGRFSYLHALVNEFQDSNNEDAKVQVLANLANFAYDPINYDYFRSLNIVDLFLDCLQETNEEMVNYAISGLCNVCLDRQFKTYILENDGVKQIVHCLASSNEGTVLSAITTLMYLTTPESRQDITTLPVVDAMLRFSKSSNARLSNLAKIFIQDYCSPLVVSTAEKAQLDWDNQVQSQAATILQTRDG